MIIDLIVFILNLLDFTVYAYDLEHKFVNKPQNGHIW